MWYSSDMDGTQLNGLSVSGRLHRFGVYRMLLLPGEGALTFRPCQ